MDIITELKKHDIDAEIVNDSIKFTFNQKDISLKITQLENLFLETLINQIKFQSKL